MSAWWCESALLPDGVRDGVLVTIDGDLFSSVLPDQVAGHAQQLVGLTLPGLANTHSHAFHRALRGQTHQRSASFWGWREQMYTVAQQLDPDSYLSLARATYAEMALAGISAVGEFHYLHHARDGRRYDEPNAMSEALIEAATQAGIRLTLLDTCYLSGGIGEPVSGLQRRFTDGGADGWADRFRSLAPRPGLRLGAAIHSVRAVPREQMPTVVATAASLDAPLHVHLSEQPAENVACLAAYGLTPTELLADVGALGTRTCAVHATHLTDTDIDLLGSSCTSISMCPTTERDLADGIGPAAELAAAGSPLCVGSDSQAVIDLFEETRQVELHERLRSGRRGTWTPSGLARMPTVDGHRAIGWPEGGRIEVGALADLVTVSLDSVRTAGVGNPLARVLFAATTSDIRQVVVGGRVVTRDGHHLLVPDVAAQLTASISGLT